jgi:hypothetical protein
MNSCIENTKKSKWNQLVTKNVIKNFLEKVRVLDLLNKEDKT